MLNKIFEVMFSSGNLKFLGAFLWGIASVILSPCGISIVPLVVGYIANTEEPSKFKAFKISCAFCLGIIINLCLVAFVISGLGMIFSGYERFLTLITAIIFIIMGLHLTGIIHLKFFEFTSGASGQESHDIKGAVILGIISGLAIGPCNIAYVSPILSLAVSSETLNGIILILSYALGYSFVLICAGTFGEVLNVYLEKKSFAIKIINIICGLGLIFGGIYFIYEMRFFM